MEHVTKFILAFPIGVFIGLIVYLMVSQLHQLGWTLATKTDLSKKTVENIRPFHLSFNIFFGMAVIGIVFALLHVVPNQDVAMGGSTGLVVCTVIFAVLRITLSKKFANAQRLKQTSQPL